MINIARNIDRPTRETIVVAVCLLLLACGLAVSRYVILGGSVMSAASGTRWRVSVSLRFVAKNLKAYVKMCVPPKTLSQQIFSEEYRHNKDELVLGFLTEGVEENRLAEWRNISKTGERNLAFSYSAHMRDNVFVSSPPIPRRKRDELIQYYLKSTDLIQAAAPLVQQKAKELRADKQTTQDIVDEIYRYCTFHIANGYEQATIDAVTCLTNLVSDCGGKSRLMVALCRACGIPARVVGGLILAESIKRETHAWVEVWQDNTWVPYCPLNRHYKTIPNTYLVLYRGDVSLLRYRYIQDFSYDFKIVRDLAFQAEASSNSWLRNAVIATSFTNLAPHSQWVLKVLLLIPLGALVVCVFRNIVGLPTLGTFAPVLIALGIYMAPLLLGIAALLLFISIGFFVRWALDRLKLLLVPRLATMLTFVIMGMLMFVVCADKLELSIGSYVGLLPVVILTMSIERTWILEIEDGFLNVVKHLLGTLTVVAVVYFVFQLRSVVDALFMMPELLLGVVALMLLIGRYSGFRFSEYLRFRAIVRESE